MICGLPSPKLSIRGQPFVALVKTITALGKRMAN